MYCGKSAIFCAMSPARQCVKALNNKAWLACADNNTEIEMITYILTCSPVVIIHRKPSSQLKACRFYLAGSWLVNILKNQYKSQSILFVVSHYVFSETLWEKKKERKRERGLILFGRTGLVRSFDNFEFYQYALVQFSYSLHYVSKCPHT